MIETNNYEPTKDIEVSHLNNLKKYGFSKLGPLLLTDLQRETLKSECLRLLEEEKNKPINSPPLPLDQKNYRRPIFIEGECKTVFNIIGLSSLVDDILESFFSHPLLKKILTAAIGPYYKLWQANIRYAGAHEKGLGLHQDQPSETGLSILLNETTKKSSTTVFLPRSHRFPVSINDTGFSYMPTKYISKLLKSATGNTGDTFIFFNKTWHGRSTNKSGLPAMVLIMSLFPVDCIYTPYDVPTDILSKIGPELRNLLDPQKGVQPLQNGSVRVTSPIKHITLTLNDRVLKTKKEISLMSPWHLFRGLGKISHQVRQLIRHVRYTHESKKS